MTAIWNHRQRGSQETRETGLWELDLQRMERQMKRPPWSHSAPINFAILAPSRLQRQDRIHHHKQVHIPSRNVIEIDRRHRGQHSAVTDAIATGTVRTWLARSLWARMAMGTTGTPTGERSSPVSHRHSPHAIEGADGEAGEHR